MFLGTERTSAKGGSARCHDQELGGEGSERTAAGQLDEVQLLALLGASDVGGDEGVHEGLEVGAPPLGQGVANLPLVVDTLAGELRADGGQALIQAGLEAVDLVVLGAQVVAGQLEKGIGDLQHQDVGVVVLVADEDALAGAAHAMLVVVLFEALQAGQHGGVFFGLGFLGAEGVVAQRIQANGVGLVGIEFLGQDGASSVSAGIAGVFQRRRTGRSSAERSG